MKKIWLFSGNFLLLFCLSKAQLSTGVTPIRFCKPGVSGMLPGKGLEIFHEVVPGYNLSSPIGEDQNVTHTDRVQYSYQWGVKLKIPVVLRDDFTLLLDTKYAQQKYNFASDRSINTELHQTLTEETLQTLRLGMIGLKPLNADSYLVGQISVGWNSNEYEDFPLSVANSVINLTLLYGKKIHRNLEWGVGIAQTLQFGTYRAYPVFMLNQTFNNKWGLEMVLPKEAFIRRNFNEKTALKIGVELDGSNYNLQVDETTRQYLQLRQGFLRAKAQLEWQLAPMVWTSFETGYIFPVSFRHTYPEVSPSFRSTQENSWYTGISISLRAPR
ncbi:MAG: DUF6268 family outer membrane beta-barrel protein [Bacteroidota bacterium]